MSESAKRRFSDARERRKLGKSVVDYMKSHNAYPYFNIGKNETQLLDEQEKKDGVRILRQWDTGIGYVADGYCPKTNTIYEVYEKHHNNQVRHDSNREIEIRNHLGCNFIIIWDK